MLVGLLALTFATAEGVRPTHFVPKKIAAGGLILHSQGVAGGASDSLDPELLAGVPRIHPDAVGEVRASRRPDGSFSLTGSLEDPLDGSTGAAAFIESDGSRLSAPGARYGAKPNTKAFSIIVAPAALGRGSHRLYVALISADQRGFFRLPNPVLVRVDR